MWVQAQNILQEVLSRLGTPWLGALVLVVAFPAIWRWTRRLNHGVPHPDLSMHQTLRSVGWPLHCCQFLLISAFGCFAVAVSHPRETFKSNDTKLDTRAFWVCLDRSGSMNTDVPGNKLAADVQKQIVTWHEHKKSAWLTLPPEVKLANFEPEKVKPEGPTRFQLARYFSGELMSSRPAGDRVGVSIFSDQCDTKIIPSTDLNFVKSVLYNQTIEFSGGTNVDGPTRPGQPKGAIQECLDGFNLEDDEGNKLCPERTRIIMLISDGDATISDKRFNELRDQMLADPERPIRIYGFVIGAPEQMNNENVKSLRKFCAAVNGKDWPESVFLATDPEQLDRCLKFLANTEKTSTITVTRITHKDTSAPWLVAGSIFFLLFGIATWPLRIPN